MTPEEQKLQSILDRAYQGLARFSDEELHAALQRMDAYTAAAVPEGGMAITAQARVPDVFATLDTVARGRASRSRVFSVVAIPLLTELDPAAAAPLFHDVVAARFKFWAVSYEGWIVMVTGGAWWKLAPLLPAGALGELWLSGAAETRGLTDEQLAAVPAARVAAATVSGAISLSQEDARRYCAASPELADGPACVAFLRSLTASTAKNHSDQGFLRHLVPLVARLEPEAALPILLDLYEQRDNLAAKEALFRLRHLPTLEKLAAKVDAAIRTETLTWDPWHVHASLLTPLRAMFALEPSTSAARFGRFFTDEAMSTEAGAKVARDILAVGNGIAVNHGGTVLKTGDANWLSLDGGWQSVLERVAVHPRLGPLACELLPKGSPARKLGLAAEKKRVAERVRARKDAKEAKARAAAERKALAAAKKASKAAKAT